MVTAARVSNRSKLKAERARPVLRQWALDRLTPFAKNPRVHTPEQVAAIARSIEQFGFLAPVIVDERRGRILAGHARVEAARHLGRDRVPVIAVGHLSPAEQRAYLIADNRLAELAAWDRILLAEHLEELERAGLDVSLTGFDDAEIAELLAEAAAEGLPEEEPPVPPAPEHPVSRPGDIWILGHHRVMCGDSTSIEDVKRLVDGQFMDCVWTDPPYNVAYEGEAGSIENDAMAPEEFRRMLAAALRGAFSALRPGGPIYVCHATTAAADFYGAFVASGFKLAAGLVWIKNAIVMGRGDYHFRHEPILYGWKPGQRHCWFGDRKQQSVFEWQDPPFAQVGENEWTVTLGETVLLVRGRDVTVEAVRGSAFFEDKPLANPDHPTMKPVPLIERMLRNSARAGGRVLDPFGGSGSTLVACERLGMRAHLMELSPRYADVIVTRWQNLTQRQALHATTGKPFRGRSRKTAAT